jgi:hypothetical protein
MKIRPLCHCVTSSYWSSHFRHFFAGLRLDVSRRLYYLKAYFDSVEVQTTARVTPWFYLAHSPL